MYAKFAKWYDTHYKSIKDYPAEAQRIDYILNKLAPKPSKILDIGCGTGEHAKLLSREFGYQVDGIDLEPQFIEAASAKNPNGDFFVADMRTFSLPMKYDAVLCLFSSIAYSETAEGLSETIENISKHLNPGGWLLIEPWAQPSEWHPDLIDANESEDEANGIKILQARQGSTDGNVSILTIDYHITEGDENHEFTETHRLGLFSREQMEGVLEKHGFEPRFAPIGILARPIYLACYLP